MQTVAADAINSRNKQKSNEVQTKLWNFQENKGVGKRIAVKMQTDAADETN